MLTLTTIFSSVYQPAHADLFGVWARAKGDFVTGEGTTFERFDGLFGGGVEAGIELIGISLWGDWLVFGEGRHMGSANLGFDLAFGDDLRLTIGAYGSALLFLYLEEDTLSSTLNFSDDDRAFFMMAGIE
ncbi:MAG: hypothetical protein VYD19_05985, partial [Myxococcota bacterium]|nr:hypothetical protein [Myxococcota bacterium]